MRGILVAKHGIHDPQPRPRRGTMSVHIPSTENHLWQLDPTHPPEA
jgi:hypothetical protein